MEKKRLDENRQRPNAVRCLKCKDVIESKHVHDFKYCSCGNVAVDGGRDYRRRVFVTCDWEEIEDEDVPSGEITDEKRTGR